MSKDVVITDNWLDSVAFDAHGLVPAIAQCVRTQRVLMVAWMNLEALQATVQTKQATYYSRSRKALWHKGEESGHTQHVKEIRLDCDGDVIILQVEQVGGVACHTGRQSCFYYRLDASQALPRWTAVDPVLIEPAAMYPSAQSKAAPVAQSVQHAEKQAHATMVSTAAIVHHDDTLHAVFNVIQSRIAEHADDAHSKAEGSSKSYVASLVHKGPNAVLKKVGEEACELVMACKDRDPKAIVSEAADLWFHSMVALASHNATFAEVLAELNRRMGVSGLTEKASRDS